MLLTKTIDVKISPSNYSHFKKLGYCVVVGASVTSDVSDLPPNSNIKVICKCDICNVEYNQRYSRNKSICGKCITSNRMKNNKYGCCRKKYQSPTKEQLLDHITNDRIGCNGIAKLYGVSIPVVKRWLKEIDIVIPPHYGKKYFKSFLEESEAIDKIKEQYKQNNLLNIAELANLINIPRYMLMKLNNEKKVEIFSQFNMWNKEYIKILENMPFYIKENETKTLKTISSEYNISIEHLKRAFLESNIKVKLHSYTKSKGELECKYFINNLDDSIKCYSAMFDKKYEIDCYVATLLFGVEYCGEYWHRYDPLKNNKYYHVNKLKFCNSKNIDLITIFESEWKNKRQIVESMIRSRLKLNNRIYARKCTIKEITSFQSNTFHAINHINGKYNSTINIGLFYDQQIVSVLSICKSRFDKKYQYEISRYSTILNHTVVGGFSKMFNYFIKQFNPDSCMTYADLRFGKGKTYEKNGFVFLGTTPPNYFYINSNSMDVLESRFKYQKHKLKNMSGYTQTKSEFEIMSDSGYYRIYDCGNNKYGWIQNPAIHSPTSFKIKTVQQLQKS